jgi:hypothetical protein
LQAVRADNQRLQTELGNSEVNRQELNQELAQLRSQLETERADREKFQAEVSVLNAKFAAALEQNEKSAPIMIGVEVRSQLEIERAEREKFEAELSELNAKLAATLEQNEKSAPIAIDVELRLQLEQERADRQEIQAELSELKQNPPSAATLFDKSTLDTAIVLNQIRTRRKKLKINMEDLQVILEILESSAKKIEEE